MDGRVRQYVAYSTSMGVIGVPLAYVADDARFRQLLDGRKATLAAAEARLADALARRLPTAEVEKVRDDVASAKEQLAMGEAAARVRAATTSYVRCSLAGAYHFYAAVSGNLRTASRVRIDAGNGNDVVALSNNVPLKATVNGGSGADKLTGGKKKATLCGGGGSDRLFSRSAYGGTLDGGKGADKYYNRFGEVQVLARDDGDCVLLGNTPVPVTCNGTLGVRATTGTCYFFTADDPDRNADLLAAVTAMLD